MPKVRHDRTRRYTIRRTNALSRAMDKAIPGASATSLLLLGCALALCLFPSSHATVALAAVAISVAGILFGGPRSGNTFDSSAGLFLCGYDPRMDKPIWLSMSQVLEHVLVLGTIGTHRRATIVSMTENAMRWNSGVIYCDGSGHTDAVVRLHALACAYGRSEARPR